MKTINTLLYILLTLFMLTATNANAQNWNFRTMSKTDQDNCKVDANWIAGSGRYGYVLALDNNELIANNTELEYTKGLLFTANAPSSPEDGKAKIRCNYEKGQLELNGNGVQVTIPDLAKGQMVTVKCITTKNGEARGLDVTNLAGTTGFGENSVSADALTCTGTVSADGNVTIATIIGGMYLYSITVTDESSEVTPPATKYNDVPLNTEKNQMRLTLGNDIKYYDTDDVNVAIDKASGSVTITPNAGTWQDVYTRTVNKIDFALAEPTGSEGDIQDGGIKITEAKGWQESLYAKWEKYDGAESYNVYVKGGNYSDWTKIDKQLVRDYGSYARADVVGLVAGNNYAIKVVAVDGEGNETSNVEGIAENMTVKNYNRKGFAHFNRSEGVGAYNNDGSLKAGAKVFYVTGNTAKTISTDVKTSSSKSETFTGIQAIIQAYQKGYDTTPIAFRIIGMVKADDLDYMESSSEGLQIKGANSYSTLNITLEGIGDDATVYGFGFLIRNSSSVEFRNFAIMRCMDDGISLDTDNSNVWIHNMDLFYGQKGSAADQAKGDGTVDIKGDSKYVTIDNNHFWDSGKASMAGMKNESGPNYITYHHNWFDHSDSRHPRIRTMSVHIYNNYFDHNDVYGIGVAMGASVFSDRNYFNVAYRPMMSSKQGTDAKGDGTFSGENGGIIKAYGNIMTNKTSNFSYITYADNNTSFDAYEVASPDETLPSSVVTVSGGTSYNNFDTDSNLMYEYAADEASNVPAKVMGYYGAGRLNHGDINFTIPDETVIVNGHQQPLPALANIIDSYKSSLVGVFGDENAESVEQGGDSSDQGETGGNEGGETGDSGDTPAIEGTVTCNFEGGAPSSDMFTITGNYSNSKGSMVINGVSYTWCLKMETQTNITFTTNKPMTLRLYLNDKCTAKVDGEKQTGSNNVVSVELASGSHEIKKQDSCNLFLIELVPIE